MSPVQDAISLQCLRGSSKDTGVWEAMRHVQPSLFVAMSGTRKLLQGLVHLSLICQVQELAKTPGPLYMQLLQS